jgi:hypothetical protein
VGRVPANTIAATANGNVSLQKLVGAGVAKITSGELRLTDGATETIGELATSGVTQRLRSRPPASADASQPGDR